MTYSFRYPKTIITSILFFVSALHSFTFASGISSGTKPQWVLPLKADLDAKVSASEIEAGYYYLFLDKQMDVRSSSCYYHYVKKIVNESGVENCSQLEFTYDKAFENLVIHEIRIIRGNKVINQLDLSKMKIVQKTKDIDRLEYTETMSGLLFLEDVKANDIIEYSFTSTQRNPLFSDKYCGNYQLQFSVPICSVYYRLQCPAGRKLTIKEFNTDLKPEKHTDNGITFYTWQIKNLKGMAMDDMTPIGYDPYPSVDISEYKSWKEVKDWANGIYTPVMSGGEYLRNRAKEIAAGSLSDADKIILALRFVQDQVRYLGIETGVNTHKPHLPEQVLRQGFGDCKDKAILLCTILKEYGIRSHPVLINSSPSGQMAAHLPSPDLFDHVCIAVEYQGSYRFFDPTISYQRGTIANTYFPQYRYGLILGDSSDGLTPLPYGGDSTFQVMIHKFDVGDTLSASGLDVVTTFSGREADYIREKFASNSQSEIQKSYLNFYENYYKNISVKDSVRIIEDDTRADRIVVTESYLLPDFWRHHPGEKRAWDLYFYAQNMKGLLNIPKSHKRTMPIGITYPNNYIEKYEIKMPESWNVSEDNQLVEDSVFKFTSHVGYSEAKHTIYLTYQLHTKRNATTPDGNESYFNDIDKVTENLGYDISINRDVKSKDSAGHSFLMIFIFLVTAGVAIFICYKIYMDYDVISIYTGDEAYSFGGWLLLPVLGTLVAPLILGYNIFSVSFFSDAMNDVLFNRSAISYNPTLGSIVIVELILNSTLLVLSILAFVLLFKKRSIFPWVYIAMLSGLLLVQLFDCVMLTAGWIPGNATSIKNDTTSLFRSLVACCIWIPYMIRSGRVKRTFTNLHPSRRKQALHDIFR